MNLFFNPSERELRNLIRHADKTKPVHHVVVDFDGEVLLDPQLERPNLDLNKFKGHVQISEHIKKILNRNPKTLRELLNTLLNVWHENSKSFFEFDFPSLT
jgi:hypothetical protein